MSKTFLAPINIAKLATDPQNGKSGQVYFNTTSNKFRGYTNSWQDLGSGSGSGGGGGSNFITTDTLPAPTEFWVGTGDPTATAQIGDLWLDGSQYDNTDYIVVQNTQPTSNFGTNTLWADTTDSGLPVLFADYVPPIVTPATGDYWVALGDSEGQVLVSQSTAPDPSVVQFWADPNDNNNVFNYSSLTFGQYSSYSNFPSAATSDGMFVYAQNTGNAYYSANGSWIRLPQAVTIENSVSSINSTLSDEITLRWMGI